MKTSWFLRGLTGAALVLAATGGARADDAKPILSKSDKLTDDDPMDKVKRTCHAKIYKIKLEADKTYRIDMTSREIDPFLRLEDADGKQLAFDDDGGGFPNARIVYKAGVDGEYTIIATTFENPQPPLRKTGGFMLTVNLAGAVDLLEARVNAVGKAAAKERNAIVNDLKKHLKDSGAKISDREANMAMMVATTLERSAPKQAIEVYKDFGKLVAAAGDPRIAGMGRRLEGCPRRMTLVGNTMEVKGTTLDGKDIDLATMKGKVVLVDFWATWCGPCVREIPAMKKMYQAYHDRGFEILGVSVDQGKEAPTKFIEQRKLPWPCIHDDQAGGKSLSDHYGVIFIPLPILVDREGKVVSLSARGPELEQLLAKLIGPLEPEKK